MCHVFWADHKAILKYLDNTYMSHSNTSLKNHAKTLCFGQTPRPFYILGHLPWYCQYEVLEQVLWFFICLRTCTIICKPSQFLVLQEIVFLHENAMVFGNSHTMEVQYQAIFDIAQSTMQVKYKYYNCSASGYISKCITDYQMYHDT